VGTDTISPQRITEPKSAPMAPAPAMGPGVGGTNTWVEYRPMLKAMAKTESDCLLRAAKVRLSGERITNPESQNTGTDTTPPVKAMARAERPSPTSFKMELAITMAAPLFSMINPMMVPAAITIPILDSVLPKPPVMELITCCGGNPASSPTPKEANSRTRKGWGRTRAVITTMKAMAARSRTSRPGPCMESLLVFNTVQTNHFSRLVFQKFSGTLHGFLEGHGPVEDGEVSGNALPVENVRAGEHGARDHHAGHAQGPAAAGYTHGHLAVGGLAVELAFSSDDQIGPAGLGLKVQHIEDEFNAGNELAP